MVQNSNQFAITQQKGAVDLNGFGSNVINGEISKDEAATLTAGEAVKIEDSANGVPKFLALDAATDETFGFITRNLKDSDFVANDRVEVAIEGTIVVMEAGAAIARGASIEVQLAGSKVITGAGVNPKVGIAYDKAAADGDLIRVLVKSPNIV